MAWSQFPEQRRDVCLKFPSGGRFSRRLWPQIVQRQTQREDRREGWHSTHFVPKGGCPDALAPRGCVPSAQGAPAAAQTKALCSALAFSSHWLPGAATSPALAESQRLSPAHGQPRTPCARRGAARLRGRQGRAGAEGRSWLRLPAPVPVALQHSLSSPATPTLAPPPPVDARSQLALPFSQFCIPGFQRQKVPPARSPRTSETRRHPLRGLDQLTEGGRPRQRGRATSTRPAASRPRP
jgi:hypothetical protein